MELSVPSTHVESVRFELIMSESVTVVIRWYMSEIEIPRFSHSYHRSGSNFVFVGKEVVAPQVQSGFAR